MCDYREGHDLWKQGQPLASSVKPKDKSEFEKSACDRKRNPETHLGFDQRSEIRHSSKGLKISLRIYGWKALQNPLWRLPNRERDNGKVLITVLIR
jgi:hypothetical protein